MNTFETIKERAFQISSVADVKLWEKGNMSRVYIDLEGKNGSFRGDRTHTLYYDLKADKLIDQDGKGTTSRDFDASLKLFREAF